MVPGPSPPTAAPPLASKRVESARDASPKAADDGSKFESAAEGILEALAQRARLPLAGQASAAPGEDRPAGRGRSESRAGGSEDGLSLVSIGGSERREDPFGKLNQTRESYGTAQERQRSALRPPGSLLDFKV